MLKYVCVCASAWDIFVEECVRTGCRDGPRTRTKVHDFITHKWFFIWITLFSAYKRYCNQNNTHTFVCFFLLLFLGLFFLVQVRLLHFCVQFLLLLCKARELHRDQPDFSGDSLRGSFHHLLARRAQYVSKCNQISNALNFRLISAFPRRLWPLFSFFVVAFFSFFFCVQLHKSYSTSNERNKYIQIKQIAHFVCRKIGFMCVYVFDSPVLRLKSFLYSLSKIFAWLLLFLVFSHPLLIDFPIYFFLFVFFGQNRNERGRDQMKRAGFQFDLLTVFSSKIA